MVKDQGALCDANVLFRPSQFAEETKRADRVVPWCIIWSVLGTALLGTSFLLTLMFCIQVLAVRFVRPHTQNLSSAGFWLLSTASSISI